MFEFTVDYEYVDVMMKDKSHGGEAVRLIVDMDFRSQFELARPTSTYLELLSSLPSIFVGTEEKLAVAAPENFVNGVMYTLYFFYGFNFFLKHIYNTKKNFFLTF